MGKTTKLQTAKSWIMLGFLILVSFAVILLSREQGELFTGHTAIQPIARLNAGSQETFEIKTIPGVAGVTVTFSADTKNNLLTVKEDERIPFDGKFYSKFAISWKDPSVIERMEFTLKILEQEVHRKGINPAELRLYVNGQEVTTTLMKRDERYLYYKATSTGAGEGEGVIGKANLPTTAQPTTALPVSEWEEAPAAEAEESPTVEEPASPSPLAERVIQQPQPTFGQQFWNWLKLLVGAV